MAQHSSIRVLIIDAHPLLISGIRLLLDNVGGFHVVAEGGSLSAARRLIAKHRPQVLIMDANLPDGNGIDGTREILHDHPDLRVLIFSGLDEKNHAERALRAGALGYLMKSVECDVITSAIQDVAEGRLYLSSEISGEVLGSISRNPRNGPKNSVEDLTKREFEIFQLIGEGKSTRSIAGQLGLSPKTVDVHRANMKEKLGVKDLPSLIRMAVCWVESRRSDSVWAA